MVYLYSGSALRVGFTVGSDAIPCTVTGVRFEVVVSAQSGTLQPGEYGYAVYSGGAVATELSGQEEVGEDWQDITVSDALMLSGLSDGLGEVAFQVNGPSSNQALKLTRVRMVVEYAVRRIGGWRVAPLTQNCRPAALRRKDAPSSVYIRLPWCVDYSHTLSDRNVITSW